LTKDRDAKEVVDGFSIFYPCESSRCFIRWHQSTAPVEHEGITNVRFARFTFIAFCTFTLPYRYAFVARLYVLNLAPNTLTNPEKNSRIDIYVVVALIDPYRFLKFYF
jgi:hypothetical protein